MRPDDSDYYRARAIEERWLARDTDEPVVADRTPPIGASDPGQNRIEARCF